MKLTLYLFKSSVVEINDAILDRYLEGDAPYEEVPLKEKTGALGFEAVLYSRTQRTKTPPWVKFLGRHFDLGSDELQNELNSAVLLLRAGGRVFAVPFGHGYHALDRVHFESDFGLRTALNVLGEDGVKALHTRNVDTVTRQQRTNMNHPTGITSFGIDEYVDWVRSIEGKPLDASSSGGLTTIDISSISGSDSLKVGCKWKLRELAGKCEELLKLYESEAYKEKFAFIDRLQPIAAKDDLNNTLDDKLNELLIARDWTHVAIAIPDIDIDYGRLEQFQVKSGRSNHTFEELELSAVYSFFDQLDQVDHEVDSKAITVIALDENGSLISSKRRLHDYLVAEIQHDGETYVLSLGRWFLVASSYLDEVNTKIQALEDCTLALSLPPIQQGESEGEYNDRVAKGQSWVSMDKKCVSFTSHTERIEVCDIATADGDFLCVKKMTSSATLSHLFGQGSVSASLMKEPEYLKGINEMLAGAQFQHTQYTAETVSSVRIVYAIATTKQGPIADCLFFFSRINLLSHVEVIRRLGVKVALCKIEYI